jgi:UPF0755 protein
MKKLIFVPMVFALMILTGAIWFYVNTRPVSNSERFVDFIVAKGSSASEIGKNLESAGLIRNELAFRIYFKLYGHADKIQSGQFRLSASYSLLQIIKALLGGPEEVRVTIPEGLRREEIAQRFAASLGKGNAFVSELLQDSKGMEGYLFPDTYLIPADASPSAIIRKMNETFRSKTAGLSSSVGLSFDQSVVLASIVERETRTNAERPIVAGILVKRLNAGMALQVDATIQYAIGNSKDWWPIVTPIDLQVNSPFNTYVNKGLPPTPICNPGLSSLKAAFNPIHTDYWYYIHDPSGQIHYATTLAEQTANIKKYLNQ